ncbi:MAG: glycosyltransferase family 4 protein [Candidatus Micrarchaeota archaeon]|nr:glycosyltransferase family 4 protein [Candidatus Micrarchaeota archaeon]
MDLILVHPFFDQKGGLERSVLEIIKKFNPTVYYVVYEPEKTFEELKEFDLRPLPKVFFEPKFFDLKLLHRKGEIASIFRCLDVKFSDYDVINAHGTPSHFVANKNERVFYYCHSPNRLVYDLFEERYRKKNMIGKLLMHFARAFYVPIDRRITKKIEKIACNSEITKERLAKYIGRTDAEVIWPGIEPNEFENKTYDKYFLYVSRFISNKRFEKVIEAFKIFCKKRKDFSLVLAGNVAPEYNEYLEELKNLAQGYKIEFKTNLSTKELKELYSNCYAGLFYAIEEDFGLVPLEYMASSKPCISVNEGGPKYSIIDKKTGFLVDSPEQMAQKMLYLAENPQETENMGKKAREHVLKNFSLEVYLEKIEEKLKEVAKRN